VFLFGWTFQEGSITIINVESSGFNYLAGGDVRVTGGGGSDFSGVTQVDVSGALTGITILDHGHSFTSDPDAVSMYYNGTDVKMVCPCLAHLLFCIIGCLSCVCVFVYRLRKLTFRSALNVQNQSISGVQILNGGQGYVAGNFNITSSEGFDFQSSFTVNSEGAVTRTLIESHGRDFTTNPSVYDMYYAGTSVKQVW
jgi:hypothetical protein